MSKIFQRIILLSLLLVLIVPQVVFATWWNPFTWKIFQKKTPVVEQVMQDYSTDILNKKTDKPVEPPNQIPIVTPTVKMEPSKPIVSTPTKMYISCNGQSYEDTCTSQGLKSFCGPDKLFCVTQQQVDKLKVCNGITYDGTCGVGTEFFCPSSGKPYCSNSATQLLIDRIDENKRKEDDLKKQQEERMNSPECKEASEALNKVREEIKSAREKSNSYDDKHKGDNDPDSILKSMKYFDEYMDLSNQQSLLLSDYWRACEGISVIPPIPKTYNTTCRDNGYGLINCSTY